MILCKLGEDWPRAVLLRLDGNAIGYSSLVGRNWLQIGLLRHANRS